MSAGTLDKTIFNDLISNHTARIDADIEAERIAEFVVKHKEDLEIEEAVIGAELDHDPNAVGGSVRKNVKGKKNEELAGAGFGGNFEKPAGSEAGDILDPQEKAFRDARKNYVETEFNERNALQNVRSYFSKFAGKEDKTETPNIAAARMLYENLRKERMNKEISDLENSGTKGAELQAEIKKILTYYNTGAALELYNERIAVRTAQKKETEGKSKLKSTWDNVTLKMDQVAEFYNKKVPFLLKTGLAVGAFYAGAGVFSSGKRMWGAFMMATAGGMQLDAVAQFVDNVLDKNEDKKNLKEISKEYGEVDFEKLIGILNEKIADVDRKVNKHVMRSYVNKFLAVGLATIVGVQALQGIAHAFEHATATPTPNLNHGVSGSERPKIPKILAGGHGAAQLGHGHHASGVGGMYETGSKPAFTAAFEDPKGLHTPTNFVEDGKVHAPANFQEALHTQAPVETMAIHASAAPAVVENLTIHEGSNFSKTLLKEFRNPNSDIFKYHPELKGTNPQHFINRVLMDFKDTHPEMAGHNPDYVLANAKIHFNPAALHAEMDDGKYGWYEKSTQHTAGGHGIDNAAHDASKPIASSEAAPIKPVTSAGVVDGVRENSNWNAEAVENQQGEVNYLNQKYDEAVGSADTYGGDGARYDDFTNEKMYKAALKNATSTLGEITKNPDGSYMQTLREVLKTFSDKNLSEWNRIEKLNAAELLSPEGKSKLGSLSQEARHSMLAYAKLVPPKSDEPVGRWVVRFMRAAKDGLIKK